MKKAVFLLVVLAFFGCQKEETIYRGQKITGDGCNESIYNTYSGTPIAGDFEFARSQVNYSEVETLVKPIHHHGTIEKLADEVTSQFTNPYERIYAIYYWIDENIDYDQPMLDSGEYHCEWQNSETVLERKLAVCEGFSNIFCALCKCSNINAVKIHGKVSYDATVGHAWNAVEINNYWYLLDVTWDENKQKGNRYFLIDPKYFYNSHKPGTGYEKWKLF